MSQDSYQRWTDDKRQRVFMAQEAIKRMKQEFWAKREEMLKRRKQEDEEFKRELEEILKEEENLWPQFEIFRSNKNPFHSLPSSTQLLLSLIPTTWMLVGMCEECLCPLKVRYAYLSVSIEIKYFVYSTSIKRARVQMECFREQKRGVWLLSTEEDVW